MTAKDYLKKQGIHPEEPIYWYGDNNILTLEKVLEDYHQAKLKLLSIAVVSQQSELLEALKGIIQCCDGNEPNHEQIYHIANDAVKASNCG